MAKLNILTLLLVLKFLLITSANYIGDVSIESTESQNVVKRAYYLITTPKVWMSTEESVCLVLLKEYSLPNAVIDVKIQSFNSREVFIQKYQALNSFSQCIQLPINEIRAERALLRVQLSDIIDETLEIRIKPSNGLTLIETSKPIYRTNEKLQFRVITLNDWLRPIEEQFEQISVENSKSIPVMQWNALNSTNGMISLELPIAEDNIFGTWKIRAITNKNVVTEKIFKVIDYETPYVYISVDSQNYIFTNDTQTVVKVCVRDSFGQLLRGQLNSLVSYFKFNWERVETLRRITLPYDLKEVEINGCYDLILQSSQLLWNSRKYSKRSLQFNFQFIQNNNSFVEEKFFEIPVVENRLIVSFPSVKLMKQYFKPGLPYFGYALVSNPDYSFASAQQMTVCYQKRDIPWTSESGYICQQIVSDINGLVHFTIPPVNENIKQIEIKVQSLNYPTIESKIVLDPTFSPSNEYLIIKPLIDRNHCHDFVEFDVFFNKPFNKQIERIYYQVIGRGLFQAPQQYILEPSQKWIYSLDKSLINTELVENFEVFVTKLRVEIPQQSALNNNLINRILLYYLDSNNNLIADSNVFLTTCSDETNHSTQISLNELNGNGVDLNLRTYENSTCAVRVSLNKPYSSLKRINQFIEKFNVQKESSARDNCELRYELSKTESRAQYSPYSPYVAPYGLDEISSTYEPVLNFGDAWDSFNDIGLLVSSNTKLDESPCEWDLYSSDVLTQLKDQRNYQIRYLTPRINKYVRNQIQDVEKSLFNEILEWNVVDAHNRQIKQQINHNLVSTSGQLYSDAVCVNPQIGITYARNIYTKKPNENSFRLLVKGPNKSRLGETLVYKVWIQKSGQQCFPIQLSFETSEVYEVVNKPKLTCNCGNSSEPISLILIPKQIGSIDVKIVATNPINLTEYNIGPDCAQTQSIFFTPQSLIKQLTVSPLGIVSEQVHNHVICTHDIQSSQQVFHDLSHLRDSSDVIVSNDLMEPMLRYVKWRLSSGNHNALDSLSAFAASYYLYYYSNNLTSHWEHKNKLTYELSKSYQSLLTYRHNDGSYSLLKSRKSSGDLALTTSIFRVLAQSKPYLSFIENGNRINRLHHTLVWIFQQQSQDGCFYQSSTKKFNVWPLSFQNQYELTGYVLTSLLDAGLDFGSIPLAKAYQCLSNNTNVFVSDIKKHPLSAIFYTYTQILRGNVEETQIWMKELQELNNLHESLLDREMLSYLGLAYYLTNDFSNAKRIGQLLVKGSNLWQTPISSYAITKLWPVLKNQRSSLKVYGNNEEIVSTLLLNETHTHHSLVGHKVTTQDNGCLLISNNRVKTNLATTPTNFQVTIDGLDKGFVTCNRRRINICIKENINYSTIHPVVKVQLITGFDVDRKLMKKLIDSDVVSKYKELDGELLLFFNTLHSDKESYCVTIPVVQKEELYDTREAYIRIYDYYNEDLNDVVPYKIPYECQIEQRLNKIIKQNPRIDQNNNLILNQ